MFLNLLEKTTQYIEWFFYVKKLIFTLNQFAIFEKLFDL